MEDEILQDELPSPPSPAENSTIEDTLDASLLTDVPKLGEAMPAGTYAFRLDSFKEAWTTKNSKTGEDLAKEDQQPYFAVQWKCQQEPHVGRVVFENIPWVRTQDAKDANNFESPRRAEAKKTLNNRLPRAKEIMEAAGFTPSGNFGFKQFLGSNPELKLQDRPPEQVEE